MGIIDDSPERQGSVWAGLEVMSLDEALERGARSVIVTLEKPAQDAHFRNRRALRRSGLYTLWCPDRFASKPWDKCLIDQHHYRIAKANGRKLVWTHTYPPPEEIEKEAAFGFFKQHLRPGMTVCELGSGVGLLTKHLIDDAGTYHCVDFSDRLLFQGLEHRFAHHFEKLRLHHDEKALLAGVPDASIDLLVSFDMFVHIKSDVMHQFMASIKRVLKPDASAIIHLMQWDASAIDSWERSFKATHIGRPTAMEYNSPDSVGASAQCLGMTARAVGPRQPGGRWFCELRRG